MRMTIDEAQRSAILARLGGANREFLTHFPGEPMNRQPLHTVYGGAQLYKAETTRKLGVIALRIFRAHAPDAETFARALELPGYEDPNATLPGVVYERVVRKLEREAVEDFRVDFEDGFGNRPDAEEDETAAFTGAEVARGMREGLLPPFIGIRIKCFTEELKVRSARTLDIFISSMLEASGGVLPENFVVTLPKVSIPEQVTACVDLLELLEDAHGLEKGAIGLELMIELTESLLDAEGRSNLPLLAQAARGRCTGAHFGTYDYTASCSVTASQQVMDHPSCDFAKHMMQVAYSGTGIFLSDGATNVMPVAPHRGDALTSEQIAENDAVVHRAWKMAYDHIQHSLRGGFYQGWDLHPGQLPIRYAACFAFFLAGLESASERLSNFIDKAAQATLVGDVFDDAATGQGLLNFFLRAVNSEAITEEEALKTGLTLEEIHGRSFLKILENRRALD